MSHSTPCTSRRWRVPESAATLQQYYIPGTIRGNLTECAYDGTNDLIFVFVHMRRFAYVRVYRYAAVVLSCRTTCCRTTSIRTQERARGRIAYRNRHDRPRLLFNCRARCWAQARLGPTSIIQVFFPVDREPGMHFFICRIEPVFNSSPPPTKDIYGRSQPLRSALRGPILTNVFFRIEMNLASD